MKSQLISLVDSRYLILPTDDERLIYRIMIPLTVIVLLLYLLGLLKQNGGMWAVHVDPNGYWQPNVNVLIPAFSTAHGLGLTTTLVLMNHDFGGPVRPWTIDLELGSYILLYCLQWSKTWVTLYAMPQNVDGPRLAHRGATTSFPRSRFSSPYLFNLLVFAGYAVPIVAGLTFIILSHYAIAQTHQDYADLVRYIHSSESNSPSNGTLTIPRLIPSAIHKIQRLSADANKAHGHSRSFTILLLVVHLISVFFFLWANFAILRALFSHVKVHRRCILNRRELLRLEHCEIQSPQPPQSAKALCFSPHSAHRNSPDHGIRPQSEHWESTDLSVIYIQNSIRTITENPAQNEDELTLVDWKAWLPSLKRGSGVGAELWKSDLMQRLDGKDQALQVDLEQRYLRLRQYFTNTMWQAIVIFVISGLYVVLACSYVFNWNDAPVHISYPRLTVIQLKYAGLIWTIGGLFLSSLHTIVAFSKSTIDVPDHSDPELESKDRPESAAFGMELRQKKVSLHYSTMNSKLFGG